MALSFITVKNDTITEKNMYIPVIIDRNAFTAVLDDTDLSVSSASFSGVMGTKPYVTVSYDGTNVNGIVVNSTATQAELSINGQSYQVPITNNVFIFPFNIHAALADIRLTLNIRVDGCPYTFIELSGRNSNIETALYKDANGVYQAVPSKSADLASYWQNNLVDMSFSNVDLATADGIAIHTLFNYVLPALNLTLTTAEQAGLDEVKNNLLPSLSTNLSNISDSTNTDIHYASYKLHIQQAKIAMDKYVADRVEISKYITLK
jgi:hypothetical protein